MNQRVESTVENLIRMGSAFHLFDENSCRSIVLKVGSSPLMASALEFSIYNNLLAYSLHLESTFDEALATKFLRQARTSQLQIRSLDLSNAPDSVIRNAIYSKLLFAATNATLGHHNVAIAAAEEALGFTEDLEEKKEAPLNCRLQLYSYLLQDAVWGVGLKIRDQPPSYIDELTSSPDAFGRHINFLREEFCRLRDILTEIALVKYDPHDNFRVRQATRKFFDYTGPTVAVTAISFVIYFLRLGLTLSQVYDKKKIPRGGRHGMMEEDGVEKARVLAGCWRVVHQMPKTSVKSTLKLLVASMMSIVLIYSGCRKEAVRWSQACADEFVSDSFRPTNHTDYALYSLALVHSGIGLRRIDRKITGMVLEMMIHHRKQLGGLACIFVMLYRVLRDKNGPGGKQVEPDILAKMQAKSGEWMTRIREVRVTEDEENEEEGEEAPGFTTSPERGLDTGPRRRWSMVIQPLLSVSRQVLDRISISNADF